MSRQHLQRRDPLKWFGDQLPGSLIMDNNQNSINSDILESFQKWYSPAETLDQATDFLSTDEITEAINQFDPSSQVQPENIYQLMTGAGYKYSPDPGKMTFQLKWLLIRKF